MYHIINSVILISAVLMVLIFIFMSTPQSGGVFELNGIFQKMSCNGSTQTRHGNIPLCTVSFIVQKDEFDRIDHYYPRRNFWYTVGSAEGSEVFYDRVTTGDWCGELPPKGSKVKVFSLGFTKYLYFWDIQAKHLYKQTCR